MPVPVLHSGLGTGRRAIARVVRIRGSARAFARTSAARRRARLLPPLCRRSLASGSSPPLRRTCGPCTAPSDQRARVGPCSFAPSSRPACLSSRRDAAHLSVRRPVAACTPRVARARLRSQRLAAWCARPARSVVVLRALGCLSARRDLSRRSSLAASRGLTAFASVRAALRLGPPRGPPVALVAGLARAAARSSPGWRSVRFSASSVSFGLSVRGPHRGDRPSAVRSVARLRALVVRRGASTLGTPPRSSPRAPRSARPEPRARPSPRAVEPSLSTSRFSLLSTRMETKTERNGAY
jgi:hypothetical protein